jgi:hypothetical protein
MHIVILIHNISVYYLYKYVSQDKNRNTLSYIIFDEYKQNQKKHFLDKVRWELFNVAMHPSRVAQIM